MDSKKILCPHCSQEIDVNSIIYHQIEEEFKAGFLQQQQEFQRKENLLRQSQEEFEKRKENENEIIRQTVEAKLIEETKRIEQLIKQKVQKEKSSEISTLQNELNEKQEQIGELNKNKAEVTRLKRELTTLESKLQAEAEIKMSEQLTKETEEIRKQENQKHELKIKELENQLEAQKALTKEMQRKQEQGSIQLQGEVQEIGIEKWLQTNFPLDTITEIKKGVRGADCLQIVHTRSKQNCGSIYYESKRAKDFSETWIQKFKDDMNEAAANVGILVTDVRPAGVERICLKEGIWICSYEEFKGLCYVIREHIIAVDMALASQENKGEKMAMLYDYLTSNEFRLQVEGIIEAYTQMQLDLVREKRSIVGHWKKREKQLSKVLKNTNYMYNSLRGMAGNAIQSIKLLELDETVEEFDEIEQGEAEEL